MTDEHAKLTAEYEQLVKAYADAPTLSGDVGFAIRHILRRLGPPIADDAVDVDELKAALEMQTSGAA